MTDIPEEMFASKGIAMDDGIVTEVDIKVDPLSSEAEKCFGPLWVRADVSQRRVDEVEAMVQAMRGDAYAAINPANWSNRDCSDAAKLKYYYEVLDRISETGDYINILERCYASALEYLGKMNKQE